MTFTAPAQTARAPARRAPWLPWLVLWLLTAIAETLLLANNARLDTLAWTSTRSALGAPPTAGRLWELCKIFGNPWTASAIVLLILLFSRRRLIAAPAAIAATALAGGLGALIRIIDGRYRPTHTDGANHWEFFRGFDFNAKDLSFPSGHATLAFAVAAGLCYLFPRGKWLFIFLAAACAFSRVAVGAHFYSDILFGGVLGWSVAWWTMHFMNRKFAPPRK